MRKIQEVEISGLGNIQLYSIKPKTQDFQTISEDGKELTKKEKVKGTSTIYCWVDDNGEEYSNVFYDVGGKKVQKINRSETIKNFEVIDKTSIIGDFMSDAYYIAESSSTFLKNWDREVGDDKAITFGFKKSSRGLKFHRAILFKFQEQLILTCGNGKISSGIEEFKKIKTSVKKKNTVLNNVVTIEAEEIGNEILSQI